MSTDLKKIRFNIQLYIWYYVSLNLVLNLLKRNKNKIDPVHPCVHVQTALPVDDCAQVPPFKQGFGLQGLLVATIPGRC